MAWCLKYCEQHSLSTLCVKISSAPTPALMICQLWCHCRYCPLEYTVNFLLEYHTWLSIVSWSGDCYIGASWCGHCSKTEFRIGTKTCFSLKIATNFFVLAIMLLIVGWLITLLCTAKFPEVLLKAHEKLQGRIYMYINFKAQRLAYKRLCVVSKFIA